MSSGRTSGFNASEESTLVMPLAAPTVAAPRVGSITVSEKAVLTTLSETS
jgi:hypothetical protein